MTAVQWYCSECGFPLPLPDLNDPKPCPNCGGVKMQLHPKWPKPQPQ